MMSHGVEPVVVSEMIVQDTVSVILRTEDLVREDVYGHIADLNAVAFAEQVCLRFVVKVSAFMPKPTYSTVFVEAMFAMYGRGDSNSSSAVSSKQ